MTALRTEFKQDITDLRAELKGDIASPEARITRMTRMIGMIGMIHMETLPKVLIGLAALAVAFFSPVAEKILTLLWFLLLLQALPPLTVLGALWCAP